MNLTILMIVLFSIQIGVTVWTIVDAIRFHKKEIKRLEELDDTIRMHYAKTQDLCGNS